jgi:hypothetical protein
MNFIKDSFRVESLVLETYAKLMKKPQIKLPFVVKNIGF